MDAHLIPTVLPVAKKIVKLMNLKKELEQMEMSENEGLPMAERYKNRLLEQIERLEKELKDAKA